MLKIFIIQDKKLSFYLVIAQKAICKSKQDETKGTGVKILTPKEMIQGLPITLAQLKAGNNSIY